MKRIFVYLIISIMAFTSFAQTESQHLTFKGVPIDGTLNEFVQKMEQKGFECVEIKNGKAELKGDCAGYKGCTVYVSTLNQNDLVSKISVRFPQCSSWEDIENNYNDLKTMLSKKYGKPNNIVEKFTISNEPKDDKERLIALATDECRYITSFKTIKGDIKLQMDHIGPIRLFVVLTYTDKINSDILKAHAIEDL